MPNFHTQVLSCTYIQPIMSNVFYEGVCDKTVSGLYRIWVVVVAAGVATYAGLLVVPFATAAFRQRGDGEVETSIATIDKCDVEMAGGGLRGATKVGSFEESI